MSGEKGRRHYPRPSTMPVIAKRKTSNEKGGGFFKHLLWQKEWLPLLLIMLLGFFMDLLLNGAGGA